jgi:hypothetical protein
MLNAYHDFPPHEGFAAVHALSFQSLAHRSACNLSVPFGN